MYDNDTAMRDTVKQIIQRAFPQCRCEAEFDEELGFWTVCLSFSTKDHVYSIKPPPGCKLHSVISEKDRVVFYLVVFIEDIKN
jgi:hypothetical protein